MNAVLILSRQDTDSEDVTVDYFVRDMRIARFSEVTITDRVELLGRFHAFVDKPLLDVTADDIRAFQATHARLSAATANVYSRHVKALYDWAYKRRFVDVNPAEDMIVPRVPVGRPHPTRIEDLRTIFACATGMLRMAFVFAAFAGLRRGEICRLQRQDLDINGSLSTALVNGKGAKQRTVPLLRPVVDEIDAAALPRSGWLLRGQNGGQLPPDRLSERSARFMADIGVDSTLHSLRHAFATHATRLTHDLLLVRDLLGHQSVATTQIYTESDLEGAHLRLAQFSTLADDIRGAGRSAETSARDEDDGDSGLAIAR